MSAVQASSPAMSLFDGASSVRKKSEAEEIQDRFLSLLVAQMKNQDPLNPLDNAQVTSQMAQLSTTQGIQNMRASMESLVASLGSHQMAQAANLIGRGVLVPGNHIGPAPENAVVGVDLDGPADSVNLVIENAAGATVRTLSLGARAEGVHVVAWDGRGDDGSAVPDAAYTFKIAASAGGGAVTAEPLFLGTVSSVSQGAQGVQLNLAGRAQVGYGDIRQIY